MLGILFALLAAFSWAVAAIFVRLGLQQMRSTTGTVISLVIGLVLIMTLAMAIHWDVIIGLSAGIFFWFLLSGFLNFPLGRFLNYASVQRLGVNRAIPIIGISPLFASAYAVLLLGEEITAPLILGTLTIIGGVALIVSARAR